MARFEVEVVFGVEADDDEAALAVIHRALQEHWFGGVECRRDGFESWETLDGCVKEAEG